MRKNRRLFLVALAPCLIIGLGTLGYGCSDKSNNDAALLAAYQAMLASASATNTNTSVTVSVITTSNVVTVQATSSSTVTTSF